MSVEAAHPSGAQGDVYRVRGRPATLSPNQRERLTELLTRVRDRDFEGRQDFLAAALEISVTAISNYFLGKNSPSPQVLSRIAQLAGVDVHDLLELDPSGNYEFSAAARFARHAGYSEKAIDFVRVRLAAYPSANRGRYYALIQAEHAALLNVQ